MASTSAPKHSPRPSQDRRHLVPPTRSQTLPATPLGLPEPPSPTNKNARPPSPLRASYVPQPSPDQRPHFIDPVDSDVESEAGDNDEEGRAKSPAASFVSNIAARMTNYMTPQQLTDAQLEAAAAAERDRSRREAEAILMREASDRRALEERMLALMHKSGSGSPSSQRRHSLPPAPLTQSDSPVDESSPKGWWSVTKAKLTPTKELTPAQQIIEDTRAREKDTKKKGKMPQREPSEDQTQPQPSNLIIPQSTQRVVTASPSRESLMSRQESSPASGQQTKDLYVVLTPGGQLDVQITLVNLARRFEKLEKWSVAHVRALEDRVKEVESWCVDQEREKELKNRGKPSEPQTDVRDSEIQALKAQIAELTSRVTLLGTSLASVVPAQSPQITSPAEATSSSFAQVSESTPNARSHRRVSYAQPAPRQASASFDADTSDLFSSGVMASTSLPAGGLADSLNVPGLKSDTDKTKQDTSPSGSYSSWSSSGSYSSNPGASGTSPTPRSRKRYTVALGAPVSTEPETTLTTDEEVEGQTTIGRSEGRKVSAGTSNTAVQNGKRSRTESAGEVELAAPSSPSPAPRSRPVSMSTKSSNSSLSSTGRFVDPLVLRRQSKEAESQIKRPAGQKLPVGQLVAFFDGER